MDKIFDFLGSMAFIGLIVWFFGTYARLGSIENNTDDIRDIRRELHEIKQSLSFIEHKLNNLK
jgi:hypothetical protein